jgi:hypothetical protein
MFSEKSDVTLLYGCNGIIFGRASILGEVMKAQGIESASLRGHAERLKKLIRLNLNDDLRIREIKRCSNEVYDELGRIKQAGKKRKTETERADSWAIIEEQARAMLEVLPTDA